MKHKIGVSDRISFFTFNLDIFESIRTNCSVQSDTGKPETILFYISLSLTSDKWKCTVFPEGVAASWRLAISDEKRPDHKSKPCMSRNKQKFRDLNSKSSCTFNLTPLNCFSLQRKIVCIEIEKAVTHSNAANRSWRYFESSLESLN